jgi:hypothetical protein
MFECIELDNFLKYLDGGFLTPTNFTYFFPFFAAFTGFFFAIII